MALDLSEPGVGGRQHHWATETLRWWVGVVQHPDAGRRWGWVTPGHGPPPAPPPGFRVLLRRWVVERTFAWLRRNRRLSKDDEELPVTEEARIDAASSRLLPISTQPLRRPPMSAERVRRTLRGERTH